MRHKLQSGSASFARFTVFSRAEPRASTRALRPAGKFAVVALCLVAAACSPKLGDGCKHSTDCSINGDRTCDTSQPGGYCTIPDCEPNSCPDNGRCVQFQPDQPRLSRSWCMAPCGSSKDCHRHAYVCRSADQLNEEAMDMNDPLAIVLDDNPDRKFCVAKKE
jgi:hypothetical protein